MSPQQKKDYVLNILKEQPFYTIVDKKENKITLPNTYNSVMAGLELSLWKKRFNS